MPFLENSVYNLRKPGSSDPRLAKSGWRVLVMRRWPRGIRKDQIDEWFADAAPSVKLLTAYQDGELAFDEFAERYEEEVRKNPAVLDHLRGLEREYGTITLLCWERPPRRCHREILIQILRQRSEKQPSSRPREIH